LILTEIENTQTVEYNLYVMAAPTKQLRYQGIFLLGPTIAYGYYNLLLVAALIKQHTGATNISFVFLSFWGVILLVITALLSLCGLIKNKSWRRALFLVNMAVSIAIVVSTIAAFYLLYKTQTTSYTCTDTIRCLFSPNNSL